MTTAVASFPAFQQGTFVRARLSQALGFWCRVRWLLCGLAALSLLALQALSAPAKVVPGENEATVTTSLSPEGGRILLEAQGLPPKPALYFAATVSSSYAIGLDGVSGESAVHVQVLQGIPEVLTFMLTGEGEVTDVTGTSLAGWAVRHGSGDKRAQRFLDVKPIIGRDAKAAPAAVNFMVHFRSAALVLPGTVRLPVLGRGQAADFANTLALSSSPGLDVHVLHADGLLAIAPAEGTPDTILRFVSTGDVALELQLASRGGLAVPAALTNVTLRATAEPLADSVKCLLHGQIVCSRAGVRLRIFSGQVAPMASVAGQGWHLEPVSSVPPSELA